MTEFADMLSKQVEVSIQTKYIPDHSNELEKRYVFSYTIKIANHSKLPLKLLTRYWLITDANEDTSTVAGEGVIGKQPTIEPSTSFEYTSGCILKTPVGTMEGHYQMIDDKNKNVQIDIPVFRLAVPNILN